MVSNRLVPVGLGLQTGKISIIWLEGERRKMETERFLPRHFSVVSSLSVLCADHNGIEVSSCGDLLLLGR